MDRIAINLRKIIIPSSLQDKAINQLNINHMGMAKEKNASM